MATPRTEASPTVSFIDNYRQAYQNLFSDVRNYEAFKWIHLFKPNHQVWMMPGDRKRYNRWKAYQQKLSRRKSETSRRGRKSSNHLF